MTVPPTSDSPDGLLCKRCDVYVGYGALGVAKPPVELPWDEWNDVCWVCRRPADEIQAAQGE